jgi:hypothetical protein
MDFNGVVLLLTVLAILALLAWGALTKKQSIPLALVALFVSAVTSFLSYYAALESHSTPWSLGYGAVALFAVMVFVRQFLGRGVR